MILTNEKLREALKDTRDFNNIKIIKEIAYMKDINTRNYFTSTNSPINNRKRDFGCGTNESKKSIKYELSNLSILTNPAGIKSIRNRKAMDIPKSLSINTDQNNINFSRVLNKSKGERCIFSSPLKKNNLDNKLNLPYLCLTPERDITLHQKQIPSKFGIEKEIQCGVYFLKKPKIKVKKFKKLKDVMKMTYYQKNMNGLKDKINYDKIQAEFQRLKNDIYKSGQKNSTIIIKNFLYKNGIFDISVFNIRNFDNLLYFIKSDFSHKIDCKKSIKEIVIDILNGQLL